jgi:hypothetical protein
MPIKNQVGRRESASALIRILIQMGEHILFYANAIQAVLSIDDHKVYPSCRSSLLHKIIQDASCSSTNKERYRSPAFYWSLGAVSNLVNCYNNTITDPWPDQFSVVVDKEARKKLRQEHVVPTGLVIRHLLSLARPNSYQIMNVLNIASTVCIVTPDENRRLFKAKMPPNEDFMTNKWARYRAPKEGNPIRISRYSCKWIGETMTFSPRPDCA